ncbi:hypothetical protein F4813DRAFT_343763 [Daldinia decipiens]|uniref:uncharacterized protein n=1 Tax=Daldinia decipiens TaxID=326647 RepID=UPI0020C42518|nr:uncharacterized protein F4813DRAFT_343763 [Daldinia decipiens]KAI1662184.1 hypothetical protein F4813DRAFT_343763 [Daldinia decipiens]
MVGTRSGAQVLAKGHIPDGGRIQQHSHSPESVDSGEDEIPCILSPRRSIDPSIRSLDHRRKRSRQLDDDLSVQFSSSKRRKVEPTTNSRNARLYPTPVLPSARRSAGTISARKASRSPEYDVPPGLVSSVNAAFKKKGRGDHQQLPASANSHLNNETTGSEENEDARENVDDNAQVQSNHDENIGLQEFQAHDATGISGRGKSSPALIIDHGEGHELDSAPNNNNIVQHGPDEVQSQADIWDIPVSPGQQPLPRQSAISNVSGELPLRARRIEVHIPHRGLRSVQFSQTGQTQTSEHPRSALEGDQNGLLQLVQPNPEVGTQDIQEEDEVGIASERIDGLSSDDESLSDFDLSEDGFAQDVAKFRARYPRGYKGSEILESPQEDDVTMHIDSSSLEKALRLIGHEAWSGKGRKWHERPFLFDFMQPGPVRVLLKFLTKLERLLVATPKAPQIIEQNKFFNDYGDLFGYYFSKIKLTVRHIRGMKPAKGGPSRLQQNQEIKKHDQLAGDIASLAIPMLFHVLASVWWLGGGKYGGHSSFTISAIELLMRTLGWIGLLYRPLLRALRQQPPGAEEEGEGEEETKIQRKTGRLKREKREELEGILNELKRLVESGPDILEREERRLRLEHQANQERLRRQEEVRAQRRREEELLRISNQDRQLRSVLSIRGVHMPLSQSRISTSTRGSLAQEPSQIRPSQNPSDWSDEEKIFLFKKIQESYPDLPDLDDVRWELNRTLNDTEAMAEELLEQMLKAVCPQQTAADRNAHIQEIMQNYRRTWGH